VICPTRDESLDGRDLGHIIYCIGITADFRRRPHDTITAHVTKLQEVLTRTSFESLVYLSSTRVYSRCVTDHSVQKRCQFPYTLPIRAISTICRS